MYFLLGLVGGVLILFSGLMYVLILGPSRYHRDGYVGALSRFLMSLPDRVGECMCTMCYGCRPARGKEAWKRFSGYVLGRNWFVVFLYILFFWPVEVLYIGWCVPVLRASWVSKCISVLLVVLSEGLYGAAVLADPGTVSTDEKVKHQLHQCRNEEVEKKRKGVARPPSVAQWGRFFPFRHSGVKPGRVGQTLKEEYCCNRRYPVDGMLYAIQLDPSLPKDAPSNLSSSSSSTRSSRVSSEYEGYRNALGKVVGFGVTCTTCGLPKPSRSKHCRMCNRCVRRFDHHCPWINNDVAEGTQRYFIGFIFFHLISCVWGSLDLYTIMRQFLVDHRMWGWRFIPREGHVVPLSLVHYIMILTRYRLLAVVLFSFSSLMGVVLLVFFFYAFRFAIRNLTVNDMEKIDCVMEYMESLSTPAEMYKEACAMHARLKEVYARPHRLVDLKSIPSPPPHVAHLPVSLESINVANVSSSSSSSPYTPKQLSKERRAYVDTLLWTVRRALQGIYDRGILLNLFEVFFPYAELTNAQLDAAGHWVPSPPLLGKTSSSSSSPSSPSSSDSQCRKRKGKGKTKNSDGKKNVSEAGDGKGSPSSSFSPSHSSQTFYGLPIRL